MINFSYPTDWATSINMNTPLTVFNNYDSTFYNVFIGASPRSMVAHGRSDDLDAIIHVIENAEKVFTFKSYHILNGIRFHSGVIFQFIHINIGEYLPSDAYKGQKPWLKIDNKIRQGN